MLINAKILKKYQNDRQHDDITNIFKFINNIKL